MKRPLFLSIITLTISIAAIAEQPTYQRASQREQKSTTSSAITGRVLNDSSQPIAGAVVMVNKISSRPANRNAITDEEGKFRVDDLPQGLYHVWVRAPGYVDARDKSKPWHSRPGDNLSITMIKGGVITGMVTSSDGEPVVGVTVNAIRVRESEGRKTRYLTRAASHQTDDRGVYRIYGLSPGTYLVSTGRLGWFSASPLTEMPTFYPSATVDTAAEVTVLAGQEINNIDIRHRSAQGYTISGQIIGALPTTKKAVFYSSPFSVELAHASNGLVSAQAPALDSAGNSFAIEGVDDGEYVLIARRYGNQENDGAISKRIRVSVRGADVTGLQVSVVPYATITGRVIVEAMPADKKAKCEKKQPGAIEEILIYARPEQTSAAKDSIAFPIIASQAVPDETGEFKLLRLEAGRFHISPDPINEDWYVRAITIGQAAQSRPGVDVARSGLSVKSGERVTGLTIAIAEGAASLSGRIKMAEGAAINERMRVYLVPVEADLKEDPLRYREAEAQSDGSFAIKNLAPGRYWIIARPDNVTDESMRNPAAQTAATRASLRREAEAGNIIVELKSCERAIDYRLQYPSLTVRPAQKEKN